MDHYEKYRSLYKATQELCLLSALLITISFSFLFVHSQSHCGNQKLKPVALKPLEKASVIQWAQDYVLKPLEAAEGNLAEFRCTKILIQNTDDVESIAVFFLSQQQFYTFYKWCMAFQIWCSTQENCLTNTQDFLATLFAMPRQQTKLISWKQ